MTPPDAAARPATVLLLAGDPFAVEAAAARLLRDLAADPPAELVAVLDGPAWDSLPLVQSFRRQFPAATFLAGGEACDHPGVLLNRALPRVESDTFTVAWPGVPYAPEPALRLARRLAEKPAAAVAYGRVKPLPPPASTIGGDMLNFGHLQMADMVSLAGAVVRTAHARQAGGCDPDPAFQRFPGWDLTLRLARRFGLVFDPAGAADAPRWDWDDYPFLRTVPVSRDLAHRLVVRPGRYTGPCDPADPYPGLAAADAAHLRAWAGREAPAPAGPPPLRVLVTGGPWEPVHNQLCFFNYFETEAGRRRFDWKAKFEEDVAERDLDNLDLVIVSRGRGWNVPNILDWCERRGVPTLFMIDDNWLTIVNDWPVYRDLFSPGAPDYERFVGALRRCDATLVYTPRMRHYIEPVARRTVQLDVNIDLPAGARPARRGPFRLGYAGSPRYSDAAFVAATRFVEERAYAELLFCGTSVPPALSGLYEQGRVKFQPWSSYHAYREQLRAAAPDVLVAPLDLSETSRSKCPNKFLEITAAGAVGVYTETEPYVPLVQSGVNGLLVAASENDDWRAWYEAYDRLHRDPAGRERMFRRAHQQVAARFETRRAYPAFEALVEELAGRRAPAAPRAARAA